VAPDPLPAAAGEALPQPPDARVRALVVGSEEEDAHVGRALGQASADPTGHLSGDVRSGAVPITDDGGVGGRAVGEADVGGTAAVAVPEVEVAAAVDAGRVGAVAVPVADDRGVGGRAVGVA